MFKIYLFTYIFLFCQFNAIAQNEADITVNDLIEVKSEVDQFYPTFAKQWSHIQAGKPWFVGVNYSLLNDNYSTPFNFSVYHSIGGFVQGINTFGSTIPQKAYSILEFNQICKELDAMNIMYSKAKFKREMINYNTFSAGIYLALKGPFYLMAGITHLDKTNWDLYYGNMDNYLSNYNNRGEYAINLRNETKNDFLFGLAVVYPFVQFQFGYDRVFDKLFVQGGVNIALKWYKK
jgi:hypothetical protein